MDYHTGEQVVQLVELVKQNFNCNGAGKKSWSVVRYLALFRVVTANKIALIEILACFINFLF
jgi:hypothetical protein